MLRNYSYSKISIGAVTIKSIGANRIKAIVCGNIDCPQVRISPEGFFPNHFRLLTNKLKRSSCCEERAI